MEIWLKDIGSKNKKDHRGILPNVDQQASVGI